MMLIQMIQAFAFGDKIFADTGEFSYITDISLTDINGTSYDLNTKEFGKNETLRIKYKFSIPRDEEIESGEKFSVTVPKEFIVKDAKIVSIQATTSEDDSTADTTSGAGASVETGDESSVTSWTGLDILTTTAPAVETEVTSGQAASVDTFLLGNELTLVFSETKEAGTRLVGEFYVEVNFNESEIGNALSKKITFTKDGEAFEEFTLKFLFQFITGVYLNDNEFSGNLALNNENFEANYKTYYDTRLSKVQFEKDSQMYIGYKFVIPQGKAITEGQTLTINIPNEFLKLSSSKSVDLWTDDGVYYVGKVTYTTDNKITIRFAGLDSSHNEIEGNFWFGRQLNKSAIGDAIPYPITFDIGNSECEIFNLNFRKTETQPTITKTGTYSAEKQVINWKIDVDPGNFDRSNVSVADTLDAAKNTFKSGSLKINGAEAEDSYFVNNVLNYSWSSVLAGEKQIIEFQTEPNAAILNNQGVTTNITNKATLKMDGKADLTSTATVSVKNDFLYKEGSYNSNTKSIDWKIRVNTSKVVFVNPVITDELPEYLTLDPSTVKIGGIAANPADINYNAETRTFKYNLPSDSNEHLVTFSTKIDQSIVQDTFHLTKSFKNSVTLNVGLGNILNVRTFTYESKVVNVGINGDVISKSALGYNKATKEITWQIVVDSIGININSAKVTEIIGSDQEYVENSATCDGESVTFVREDPANYPNKYSISLGNISGTHIITLKTRVKDHSVIYGNKSGSCSNTVELKGSNIKEAGYTANADQSVDSRLIQKDGSYNYNYNNREVTWTIKVNESQTPMKEVLIKDVINSGQQYVDGSFNIIKTAGTTDTAATMDVSSRLSYVPVSSSDLGQGGTLNYNFGDIHDKYTITFKTKIAYDSAFLLNNGDIGVANKAEFKTSETSQEISSSKNVPVSNFMIKKDYSYTNGNDYITWNIKLNRNNVNLNGMIITDTIPDGLQIDMDSVKLYEVEFDANSNIISANSKEVDSGKYTTSYNISNKNFVLEYPDLTNKSYLLQFDTIAKTPGSSYSNKVTLKTNALTHTAQTTSSQVQFNVDAYGGSASTTTGTIAIKKVEAENANKTLSGAKFELLRDGVVLQVSDATGSDGKGIFKRLRFNTEYSIREVEAPYGYKLDNSEYKFTIAKNQYPSNVKTYAFANQKIKKDIELVKKSTNGDFLSGAEFKLYNSSDITFAIPIQTAISDENGVVRFSNVLQGNYVIKETKAPQGYNLSSTEVQIKDTDFNTENLSLNSYVVMNAPIKKTIQLHKQSEEGLPLGGATFALYKENDVNFANILKGVISNQDGLISFEGVDYGNYVIKEVMAPQGYDISDKLIHITQNDFIKDDVATILAGTITNLKAKEIKKAVEFHKQSPDGTPLAGAIFGLYSEDDSKFENMLMTTVSNSDGSVRFNNIKKDNYKIKEIQAPEGYNLTDTIIQVKASEFDVQEEVIKTTPGIVVNKLISSIGKVTDKDGKEIRGIETKVIRETDGSETLLVKSEEAILLKQPDGTTSPLKDISKIGFSSKKDVNIEILPDGNIRIKKLEKGSEEKIAITYEIGGQKIVIGTIDIKVSSDGDVTFVSQLIDPYGIVTDSTTGKVIEGVKITLYYSGAGSRNDSSKWHRKVDLPEIIGFEPNDNHNSQLTDASGSYAFMVFPYTDYYLVATKEGYDDFTSGKISVDEEIVKYDIKMDKTKRSSTGGSSTVKVPDETVNENNTNQDDGGIPLNNTEIQKPSSDINGGSSPKYEQSISNQDSTYGKSDSLYGKEKNKLLPQAGSFVDFTVLMSFGIMLIILGAGYRIRRKYS